jgi:hypothetical protein
MAKICDISELEENYIKKTWFTIDIDSYGQKTGLTTKHEGTLLDFLLLRMSGNNLYENDLDAVYYANL